MTWRDSRPGGRGRGRRKVITRGSAGAWVRPHLERLEDRITPSTPSIPPAVFTQLDNSVNAALANLPPIPIIGTALQNKTFVDGLVNGLGNDADNQLSLGNFTVTGTSVHLTVPVHASNSVQVPLTLPLGSMITLVDVENVTLWVDIYYDVEFTIDPTTGNVTMADASLSADQFAVPSTDPAYGGSAPAVTAPAATMAVVLSGTLPPGAPAVGVIGNNAEFTMIDAGAAKGGKIALSRFFGDLTLNFGSFTANTNPNPQGNLSINPDETQLDFNCTVVGGGLPGTHPMLTTELLCRLSADNQPVIPGASGQTVGTITDLEFKNINVNLGSLIATVGTVLSDVQSVTNAPVMQTFLGMMDTEVPIINLKLRDLAQNLGLISGGLNDALSAIDFINQLSITGQGTNGTVYVGGFKVSDPRQPNYTITTTTPGDQTQMDNALMTMFPGGIVNPSPVYGFHIRVLEDPQDYLFPDLIGQNKPLVTFATPPMDLNVNLANIFSTYGPFDVLGQVGVSLSGAIDAHIQLSVAYDMTGFYYDNANTSMTANGGLVLTAGAFIEVRGGIYANVAVSANGIPDSNDPNKIRVSSDDLQDPLGLLSAKGKVYAQAQIVAEADLALVTITVSLATVAYKELLNFDIGPLANVVNPNPAEPGVIRINKVGKDETIHVNEVSLPDPSDQAGSYYSAIEVVYPDHREDYLTTKYIWNGSAGFTRTDLAHYNLIAVYDTDNLDTGNQTIIVGGASGGNIIDNDNITGDGEGTPVDAVLIGGSGDDDLEYHGTGQALLIGAGGSNTLRADPPQGGSGAGVTEIGSFLDPNVSLPTLPFPGTTFPPWLTNEIKGVGTLAGSDNTVNDVLVGSGGPDLMVGGSGTNLFEAANCNVTIYGEGADNTFEIAEGTISGTPPPGLLIGGRDTNNLLLERSPSTAANPDTLAFSYVPDIGMVITGSQTSLDVQGIYDVIVKSSGGSIDVGDLSSYGVVHVVVQDPPSRTGTQVTLEASAAGSLSNITVSPDTGLSPESSVPENTVHQGFVYSNQGVQPQVEFLDLASNDQVTAKMNGGQAQIEDLENTGQGTVILDGSGRTGNTAPANNITVDVGGSVTMQPDGTDNTVIYASKTVEILGSMPQDSLSMALQTGFEITPLTANPSHTINSIVAGGYWTATTPDNVYVGFDPSDPTYQALYYPPGPTFPPELQNAANYVGGVSNPLLIFNPVDNASGVYTLQTFSIPINAHPAVPDNIVDLDASQLRGSFAFQVTDPNYTFAQHLAHDLQEASAIAFGDTKISLSGANPQLSVSITGTDPYPSGDFSLVDNFNVVDNHYPATTINIGGGNLANIQGNVAVSKAQLTVDDSQTTAPNILTLTDTSLLGWTTASGSLPVLSFSAISGELDLLGGNQDSFDVENTPATVSNTMIENSATSGPPGNVYVMGKSALSLDITGNFSLYVGRRLLPDGTVQDVGQADGIISPAYEDMNVSSPTGIDVEPITFDYTGAGQGTLVCDVSQDVLHGNYFGSYYAGFWDGIFAVSGFAEPALLQFQQASVLYGANIEVFYDGPEVTKGSTHTMLIDNPTPAPVHYLVNPANSGATDDVEIGGGLGPIDVEGNGTGTVVTMDSRYSKPVASTLYGQPSAPFTPGYSLHDTISADVSVNNASLNVVADNFAKMPASPPTLPDVGLTGDQLTGITQGVIQFSGLADYGADQPTPGLQIQLPSFTAVSTVIQGTPAGATTFIYMPGAVTGPVQVLATDGPLGLGAVPNQLEFLQAASVTIGGGSLAAINGAVYVAPGGLQTGVTIDDSADPVSHQVSFGLPSTSGVGSCEIDGLAPAPIYLGGFFNLTSPPVLAVYGSAGSQFTISQVPTGAKLFAGAGSTVSIVTNGIALDVLGAGSVNITMPNAVYGGSQYTIAPDPSRPNDATDLTVDDSQDTSAISGVRIDQAPAGMDEVVLTANFPYFPNAVEQQVLYDGNTTHLHVIGGSSHYFVRTITVADSGAAGTTIDPAVNAVSVLGTSGPVQIDQGQATSITVGQNRNMQNINGEVDISATDSTQPPLPVLLDDSQDTVARTIGLSSSGPGQVSFTGIAPAPVQISGGQAAVTVAGGTGGNVFQVTSATVPQVTVRGGAGGDTLASNQNSTWDITGGESGTLDANLTYAAIANLQGGTGDDTFVFSGAGYVSGNLDGGSGSNTLDYRAIRLSTPVDLAHGQAPLIGGLVSNIQQVFLPITITQPGIQSNVDGDTISPLQVQAQGGGGPLSFVASSLPPGLSIDPNTGMISGTIAAQADSRSPYYAVVAASDGTYYNIAYIEWIVGAPAAAVVFDSSPQTSAAGQPSGPISVELQDSAGNVTWAATGGVTLSLTSTSAAGKFMDQGGNPVSSLFIPQGSNSASFEYQDTRAGAPTLRVTAPGFFASQQETVEAAPAQQLLVSAPGQAVVGGKFTAVVSAADPFGNAVTSYPGSAALLLTGSLTRGNLNGVTAGTMVGGQVTLAQLSFTAVGSYTLFPAGTEDLTGVATTVNVVAAPHFAVSTVAAGSPDRFNVTVTALAPSGKAETDYQGTIRFTSTDAHAVLPDDYTFTATDNGRHQFAVLLPTPGKQTVSAGDVALATSKGTSKPVTVSSSASGGIDHFTVSGFPRTDVSGASHMLTITAADVYGKTVTNYTGDVEVSSGPADFTPVTVNFTASNKGVAKISIDLTTLGNQSLVATDGDGKTGVETNIDVVSPATQLGVTAGLKSVAAGQQVRVTVDGLVAPKQIDALFGDTLQLVASDPRATIAAQPISGGTETFTVTFFAAGNQTINVYDLTRPGVTGLSATIKVTPSALSQLSVNGFPLFTLAGVSHSFTVTAEDSYGNRITNFTDTVAIAGQSYKFEPRDEGIHTFTASLTTIGTTMLTATDSTDPSIQDGSQAGIVVVGSAVSFTPDPSNSTENALVIITPSTGGTIVITPTNSAGTVVAVSIDGKAQTLPVSSAAIGHIVVYCQSGKNKVEEVPATISGVAGQVSVAIPAIIFGGSGADTISVAGSSADNILVGGAGNDTLTGGSGHDILIGAGGTDILRAGRGDDVLIGGSTVYDANLAALLALMSEWGRLDSTSYQQRMANLFEGGGLNGSYLLDEQTVLRDTAVNQLIGGNGHDWFWQSNNGKYKDILGNYTSGDVVTLAPA